MIKLKQNPVVRKKMRVRVALGPLTVQLKAETLQLLREHPTTTDLGNGMHEITGTVLMFEELLDDIKEQRDGRPTSERRLLSEAIRAIEEAM